MQLTLKSKTMIRNILICITTFFCTNLFATSNSVTYLSNTDTVWIQLQDQNKKYFEHQVKPKQTLYSLSKFYGLDILDIFDRNPWLKTRVLDVHDIVKVPIQNRIIHTIEPKIKSEYAPVYYQVQKKDNLFRIARRYFDLPVQELMRRNGLKDYTISIDQTLLIGWIDLDGAAFEEQEISTDNKLDMAQMMGPFQIEIDESTILASRPQDYQGSEVSTTKIHDISSPSNPAQVHQDDLVDQPIEGVDSELNVEVSEADIEIPASTPIKEEITSLKQKFEKTKINYTYKEERGVAHWSKGIKHKTDLYVLHKTAPVGSTVQVFNPLINKSIYAKVIAKMPANMYPDKVKVVVSPAVANLLGAVDAQFFVKVKYLASEN